MSRLAASGTFTPPPAKPSFLIVVLAWLWARATVANIRLAKDVLWWLWALLGTYYGCEVLAYFLQTWMGWYQF